MLFASGFIALYPGFSFLFHAYSVDGFSRLTSDNLIADTIISLLAMLPALVFFCLGYLLLENHSLGWKFSLVSMLIVSILAALNFLEIKLALAMGIPIAIAVAMEVNSRLIKQANVKDEAIIVERVAKLGMIVSVIVSVTIIAFLFGYAGVRGAPYLNWDFITNTNWQWVHAGAVLNHAITNPVEGIATSSLGGIAGYAIGSLLLAATCELIAIPLGVGAAIYLSEYAKQNIVTETIRFFIETLAGIPSVVIGLLAYVIFIDKATGPLHWGFSLPTAAVALAIMILPFNIRVVEEAMRSVPFAYREGSYALGASQWETVRRIILFAGAPGIITGILLGVGAAIGESAVVLLTAGPLPVGPVTLPTIQLLFSSNRSFPSLPVFVYRAPFDLQIGQSQLISSFNFEMYSVAFAAAFVLIAIYLSICALALLLRNYLSKKIQGR